MAFVAVGARGSTADTLFPCFGLDQLSLRDPVDPQGLGHLPAATAGQKMLITSPSHFSTHLEPV